MVKIKPKLNRLTAEEPLNRGVLIGSIVGIGISKVIIEASYANNSGIVYGLLYIIIGMIMWWNYGKE